MKNSLLFTLFSISVVFSQNPDPAFNPMTAPGAAGINPSYHILYWQNPSGLTYNETYFSNDSSLVANMNAAVKIQSGSPSTVYNYVPVAAMTANTRYFWRVVEYNASGSTASPVWNFRTMPSAVLNHGWYFDTGLGDWVFAGPLGPTNWRWFNSNTTGTGPGEMVFQWNPVFTGDSYMMSPLISAPSGLTVDVDFNYYEDWWSDTVTIGCAYTTNNGTNWTSLWEINLTTNYGPYHVHEELIVPGNIRLGFYYTGNSNNIDFYYIDDVEVTTSGIAVVPPSQLTAEADNSAQRVMVSWNGSTSASGYRLQRKAGPPSSASPWTGMTVVDSLTFSFVDNTVDLNTVYTYRISSVSPGQNVYYGNEATAYVPAVVPVELSSFTADVNVRNVNLTWKTASETNNLGFEIERMRVNKVAGNAWQKIAFIEGNGTTTNEQLYSFNDKELKNGIYNYRLKQIDFDGTYEYSKVVEAEIEIPEEFVLQQNYPNPFNPSTTISFSLPVNETAVLKIYDILGNEIHTIVNEQLDAGEYRYNFDAGNLASGIYVYRLTAGNYTAVKKLHLLK